MNLLNRCLLGLNIGLAAAVIGFGFFLRRLPAPALAGWDYKDVVSILLAVVTVVLGALALLLALAAVWGYQRMSEHAAEKAKAVSQDYLNSDAFIARVTIIAGEHIKNNMTDIIVAKSGVTPETDQESEGGDAREGGTPADQPWRDD